jgi:NIPSNAP
MSGGPVLDLRTYRLVPGGQAEFDRIFREAVGPMLERRGIEVVAHGPSLGDDRHYFLARRFASEAEREQQLAEFYGSDEWAPYNDEVLSLIESFHHLVVSSWERDA